MMILAQIQPPLDQAPAQQLSDAVTFAIWVISALAIYAYLSHRGATGAPTRWERWRAAFTARYLTSSDEPLDEDDEEDEPADELVGANVVRADTNEEKAGTTARTGTASDLIRISHSMSDAELITLLTVQRGKDPKKNHGYRWSANDIAKMMGGTREEVLDQIRALRNLPAFPPLAPEQAALREELQLQAPASS